MQTQVPLSLLAVVLIPTISFSQNLLVNGDFESGNISFHTEYAYKDEIWNQQEYTITFDPSTNHNPETAASFGDHTTGSGLMMAVNGAFVADVTLWAQTAVVSPNTDYAFSLWLASWTQGGADHGGHLEVSINGAVIGDVIAPFDTGVWEQFTATWNSGHATSADVRIVDLNIESNSLNDFAMDDISLTQIPEPSAFALVGLTLLLSFTRFARR